ncbi:hypothetical protein RFI_03679 [Reticulomyxa filosa]|uniref:CAP-Gly domain-containing protein n=1 Tax=Reticulomyxa filosa TaxID=46433 RepID=X6P5S0_RETFI|nr:hypothetical protein RFI_03679 [Reticulomyxa filosa]|eukprot:ETO33429.1 hypothetical protein RFI_03679 [Reticulomyxa filosa]
MGGGTAVGKYKCTVGDRAWVSKKKNLCGTIRYFGPVHFDTVACCFVMDNGIWYGLELDKKCGTTNGTVKNKYYFECRPDYGLELSYLIEPENAKNDINDPMKQAKSVNVQKNEVNTMNKSKEDKPINRNNPSDLTQPKSNDDATCTGEGQIEQRVNTTINVGVEKQEESEEAGLVVAVATNGNDTTNEKKEETNGHCETVVSTQGMKESKSQDGAGVETLNGTNVLPNSNGNVHLTDNDTCSLITPNTNDKFTIEEFEALLRMDIIPKPLSSKHENSDPHGVGEETDNTAGETPFGPSNSNEIGSSHNVAKEYMPLAKCITLCDDNDGRTEALRNEVMTTKTKNETLH